MTRHSNITTNLTQAICARVEAGEPPHVAAILCGVGNSTHYDWMKKGREGLVPYVDYLEAIKRASAVAEARWLGQIQEAASQRGVEGRKIKTIKRPNGIIETTEEITQRREWQAAAWLLERTKDGYKRDSLEDAIRVVARHLLDGDEEAAKKLRQALRLDPPKGKANDPIDKNI